MVYNKISLTEIRITWFFINNVNKQYTIRNISKQIKTTYKMTYRYIQKLIKEGLINGEKQGKSLLCRFNYKNSDERVNYVEALRTKEVLKKNKDLLILSNELKAKYKKAFYTLIIFGSYASGKQTKQSDVDVLAIIPETENIESAERSLQAILSLYPLKTHLIVVRENDFKEMLINKQITNVAKEVINNHILLYGIENYYKMIQEM